MCIAPRSDGSPCTAPAVADVLVQGVLCPLCARHLFEHACEEALGLDVEVDDGRDLATIADELLAARMARGSAQWLAAHALVLSAANACRVGDVDGAIAALKSTASP